MSKKYIKSIKDLIKSQVDILARTQKITNEVIEGTFEEVLKKIRIMETSIWVSGSIDETTFRNYFNTARKEYSSLHPITIEQSSALKKEDSKTWLTEQRDKDWNYLDRYLDHLESVGRPEEVVKEISRSSKEILSNLGDPKSSSSFFVKGLVVGEVQSGKTANFNAVINRAIDSGYQIIIVFAGIMEDLRGQTQDRIESDVVGWGSLDPNGVGGGTNGPKGVGKEKRFGIHGDQSVSAIESVTSFDSDFSRGLFKGGASLNSPKVLVCKKNVAVMMNIINWLADIQENQGDRLSIPLLILDDEADNASLNNEGSKGREYASKVNGHMRAILAMFKRKSYLGYTASPFANVIQDRNEQAEGLWTVKSTTSSVREFPQESNLFPDDFIVRLKSPSNYVGAKQIFETISEVSKLPVTSVVTDNVSQFPLRVLKLDDTPVRDFPTQQDWDEANGFDPFMNFSTRAEFQAGTRASKRDDGFPNELPRSLQDSVLCFLLSIAVRESRKKDQINWDLFEPHNTMLVHVSRFITWQNRTQSLIQKYLKIIEKRIGHEKPNQLGSIYFEFEEIWNRYFNDIISNVRDYLSEGYTDQFMVPVSYEAVQSYLPRAVEEIDVLAINSSTGHKLDYSGAKPRKIIAVGGNRLSRGFTVKGLTINYFVRSTNYSDTLLQMGRWFGYRPGYLDCCRIFTTRYSIEKFNATTLCIEALEVEFEKMNDALKSPDKFILKVRKDPGVLQITRPSILKNATIVKWSYEDKLEMTTKFDISVEKIEQVWSSFKNYTAPLLSAPNGMVDNFAKAELTGSEIIKFLKQPNNFDQIKLDAMIRFIELCQESGRLTDWTIALKTTGQSGRSLSPDQSNLSFRTELALRGGPKNNGNAKNYDLRQQFLEDQIFRAAGKSANITSASKDLSINLNEDEISSAEQEFIDQKRAAFIKGGMSAEEAKQKASQINIPERVYRERCPESRAVLLIYLFDSYRCFNQADGDNDIEFDTFVERKGYDLNIPIVGYAIGFPPIKDKRLGGTYVQGDYDLDLDEGFDEDESSEDDYLPSDSGA